MSIPPSPLLRACAKVLLFGAVAAGCSSESTGGQSSSDAAGAQGSSSSTASASSSGVASGSSSSSSGAGGAGTSSSSTGMGGSCAHCSEALMTGNASNLCPPSQGLYDTFQGCRCGMLCGTDCMVPCGGGADNPGCLNCVNAQCHNELAACVADV